MDEFAGIPLGTLGVGSGWFLVALYTIGVMRGSLIPRRTYDDVVHDRDTWRAAHMISEAARTEGEKQRTHLAETAKTMNQLMSELQDRLGPGRGTRSGGSQHEQEEDL